MVRPVLSWARRARLVHQRDGDTLVLQADAGYGVAVTVVVRLLGVDTPEAIGRTRAAGLAAKAFAADWLAGATGDWPLLLDTLPDDTDRYGRWLGTLWRGDDPVSLNEALVAAGQAVAWDGRGGHPAPAGGG